MATSASAWIEGPLKLSFYTKTWTPAPEVGVKASVLFVHGFIEHVERYNHVFDKFAEEGIAVFSYDGRGFGQTGLKANARGITSWPLQYSDISFFLKQTATLHPSVPLFLVGHSMGGGLSLGFATRDVPSPGLELLKGVIASSPLLRQAPASRAPKLLVQAGSVLGKLSGGLTLKTEVIAEHTSRDPEVQKAYLNDPLCHPVGSYRGVSNMLLGGEAILTKDYKKWPKDLPLLIVHGTGDNVTDPTASELFVKEITANGAKDATFKSFEGYRHEMHNEIGDDKWTEIAALTGWIKSKI